MNENLAEKRYERQTGYAESQRRIRIRNHLVEAQNRLCPLCGEKLPDNEYEVDKRERPSLDHVLPIAMGGPDCEGNYLAVHVRCNGNKAHRLPRGCELVWLVAVNSRMGVEAQIW